MEISHPTSFPLNLFNSAKSMTISPPLTQVSPTPKDSLTLSPQIQAALSPTWDNVSISTDPFSLTCVEKDQSSSIQIKKYFSLNSKIDSIEINLTISSAKLGLTSQNLPQGANTIQFVLSQTQFHYDHVTEKTYVKPIRPPQELLNDLVEGVQEAIKRNSNQPIFVLFDQEALQSLLTDGKIAKAIQELLALLNLFNPKSQLNYFSPSTLYLSGKGKPYIQVSDIYNLEYSQQEIRFEITIYPDSDQSDSSAR